MGWAPVCCTRKTKCDDCVYYMYICSEHNTLCKLSGLQLLFSRVVFLLSSGPVLHCWEENESKCAIFLEVYLK